MALATHTVSINPAFLQEIKDDHHELRQLMHHASAMFSRPEWMRTERDRLVQLLTKLRDQLAMHFSLEEAYGYFEDAVSAAPHLSRRAEALRAALHAVLRLLPPGRRGRSPALSRVGPRAAQLAGEYRGFLATFHEHEARESELIVEAFQEDLGTGD